MLNLLTILRRCLLSATLVFSLAPAAFAQTTKPTAPAAAPDDASKLDLNTASPQQLKSLPGIGDAYAKRIVDGRPYTAKNQLTSRGILPQKTYDAIKDSIIARRPAAK